MNRYDLVTYRWDYPHGTATLSASTEGLTAFAPANAVLYRHQWSDPVEETGTGLCGYGIFTAGNWLTAAIEQLDEYLAGERTFFVVPFDLAGTDFDLLVWRTLLRIPYGSTVTYAQLAAEIGRPTAVRAVANACGRNPLPIFIPCHRVVAAHGIGGYSDSHGITVKQYLLTLEGTRLT